MARIAIGRRPTMLACHFTAYHTLAEDGQTFPEKSNSATPNQRGVACHYAFDASTAVIPDETSDWRQSCTTDSHL